MIDFARFELVNGGPAGADLDATVKLAEIQAHPDGCDSGRCVLPFDRATWHARVAQHLRDAGLYVGYLPDVDEITVGRSANAGDPVINFHVFVGDPLQPGGTVLWPPQARRDGWTLQAIGQPNPPPASDDAKLCASDGGPVPVPMTPDCRGCLGEISEGACGFCGGRCDHTPKIYAGQDSDPDVPHYCRDIGSTTGGRGNLWCPARIEGPNPEVRAACERVALGGGPPLFKCENGSEALVCEKVTITMSLAPPCIVMTAGE